MQTSFIQAVPTHYALRDYQLKSLDDVGRAFDQGIKRVILVLATGAGKTVVAAEKIRRFVANYKSVLFLVHRRKLVSQCSKKLVEFGIDHGIIMAGVPKSFTPDVQVASIQTLISRLKNPKYPKSIFNLIIIDEAHHAVAKSYTDVLDHFPGANILGLSATPARTDGVGLGELFNVIVEGPTIGELTEQGHLVPVEYYAPTTPDLTGIKTIAGDYAKDQLAERMDKPKLIGDVVENWARICPDRATIVFASSVPHSIHIRDAFRDAGVNAEHIDGETPEADRDRIIAEVESGVVRVLTNCMVFTEGTDIPILSCAILVNPSKSIVKYLQTAGRVLRPYPGKENAILIDHAGAVYKHGFVDEPKEWSLDGNQKIQDRIAKLKKEKGEIAFQTCGECKCVFTKKDKCPVCGWFVPRKAKPVEMLEGVLGKIDRNGKTLFTAPTIDRTRALAELVSIQQRRGYKSGWVGFNYKEMYGQWPKNTDVTPAEPSTEMIAWINKKIKNFRRK